MFTASLKLDLYFEFISDRKSIFVKVLVISFCKSRNFYVENLITNARIDVKQSHHIGRILALRLRRKIRQPYVVLPVFVQNKVITRVHLYKESLALRNMGSNETMESQNDIAEYV